MRIRRYAARLLASSAPASSPPPPPDASPWLHAADDDCAFCRLTRGSDPQVAADGIKHKGHIHIAGPETEAELLKTHHDLAQRPPVPQAQGDLKSDEQCVDLAERPPPPEELIPAQGEHKSDEQRIDLAERPPAPEAQRRDIGLEHSAREDAATGLEVTGAARPELQVATDGVRHTGKRIAVTEPEGKLLKSDERVDLPQRPPVPEESVPAQRCEIDYDELSARKDVVGLEITGGDASRLECREETTLVSEVASELAVKGEAFLADEAADEQEAGGTSPLVNGSVTAMEVTKEVPLLSGSVAEPEVVIRGASIADVAAAGREISEGVSPASGSIAEPDVIMGVLLDDKAVVEQEDLEGVSLASEAATGPADVVTVPGVTTGVPLDDEGIRETEMDKMEASSANEAAAEMDKMEASSIDKSAAEMDKMETSSINEAAAEVDKRETSSINEAGAEVDKMETSSINEAAAEVDKRETSSINEAGAEVDKMEASSVNEAAAEMDKMEASSVNNTVAEMDKMDVSSVNKSAAEMDVVRLGSLVIEAATHPGHPERVSLANEASRERDVSEGVSPASEAATEPADVVTASKVTTGAPLDDKGATDTDIEMEASSVNESAAEMDVALSASLIKAVTRPGLPQRVSLANEATAEQDVSEGVSPASEAATEPADVVTALEVTTGASLDGKGAADTDIKMEVSSVNESAAKMDFTPLGSLVIEATTHPELPERVSLGNKNATKREVSDGVLLVKETATEPADVVTTSGVTIGAPLDNGGIAELDIQMGAPPVKESSSEIDVIRLDSLVIEAAADRGLPERISIANETATEREVSEGVSLVNEAATESAHVVTALEVTSGAPIDDERAAEPETEMGASLVNESTAEMDCGQLGSFVTKATTHPGIAERFSLVSEVVTETGVSGTAMLDAEVSMEPEATGGPSLLNESTDLEITGGVSIAKEAAAEPKVVGEASTCTEDGGTSLNETQPLACNLDCTTVQVETAGVSVANEVQPSRDDTIDEVGSVSSTSAGPVRDKNPTADEVTPHDDTPNGSCVSAIIARSVGQSGRTDIICYRRRGKRKLDMAEMETEEIEMDDGDICDQCEEKATSERTAPACESAMSTAGSADIKLADIKRGLADNSASSKNRGLADNSASSKCKRRKGRFECDIDYCGMAFKKRSELSVHKKNMCTIKSCGKRFRSHKYMRRHQSIHNEDTPFKCPWEECSMAFKWTWALADHFQVHTGEKPYKCKTPGCSKIYKYVSDFIRHKKRCKPQRGQCVFWTK
ncbi:unnamed protein product [Alopecurus aequalis]